MGHSLLDKYGGIYTHIRDVAHSLGYIFEDVQLKVLLIVRKQNEFIEPCYLQQIKENRQLSFDEFSGNAKIDIPWCEVAKEFGEILGQSLKVLPFDLIKQQGTQGFIEPCISLLIGGKISVDRKGQCKLFFYGS